MSVYYQRRTCYHILMSDKVKGAAAAKLYEWRDCMGRLFDTDNIVWRFLGRVADLVILNFYSFYAAFRS